MGNSCTPIQNKPSNYPPKTIQVAKHERSSKLDSVFPRISQGNAKLYIHGKEATILAPGSLLEFISEDHFRAPIDPRCVVDQKRLGIGPYYLDQEHDKTNYKKTRKLKKMQKMHHKWHEGVTEQEIYHKGHFHETQGLYSKQDICMKHFAVLNYKTFPKLLRMGAPPQYRWSFWKLILKPHKYFVKGLYEKLKDRPTLWDKQIQVDLNRTFPYEQYFSDVENNMVGQDHLYNVLKAISLYFPNLGYTQGMNFLVALFLLVSGGNELQTFWMFVALARDPKFLVMGLFEKDFPLTNFYIFVLFKVLKEEMPELYYHIKKQQIPSELWLLKWFMTMYIHVLPAKDVVRVWDFILQNGMVAIVKVAVGILKYLEDEILALEGFGIDSLFKSLKGNRDSKKGKANKKTSATTNSNVSTMDSVDTERVTVKKSDMDTSIHEKEEEQQLKKDLDIDKVLKYARRVKIGVEHTKFFVECYEERKKKKLMDPYRRIMKGISSSRVGTEKYKESQSELDFYIMKSQLDEREQQNNGSFSSFQ